MHNRTMTMYQRTHWYYSYKGTVLFISTNMDFKGSSENSQGQLGSAVPWCTLTLPTVLHNSNDWPLDIYYWLKLTVIFTGFRFRFTWFYFRLSDNLRTRSHNPGRSVAILSFILLILTVGHDIFAHSIFAPYSKYATCKQTKVDIF